MDIKKIFAQRLIQLREENKITQQALADALGITRQSLSLYEKADRAINIDLLYKIAKHFNVSADYLLGISSVECYNADLQAVCNYTGLSPDAVELLNYFHDSTNKLRKFRGEARNAHLRRELSEADFMDIVSHLIILYLNGNCILSKLISEFYVYKETLEFNNSYDPDLPYYIKSMTHDEWKEDLRKSRNEDARLYCLFKINLIAEDIAADLFLFMDENNIYGKREKYISELEKELNHGKHNPKEE